MAGVDLCTPDDVREAIKSPLSSTELDDLIPIYITQASLVIMNWCNREFAPITTNATRRFRVSGYRVDLSPYDLQPSPAPVVSLHPESTQPVTLVANDQYMFKPINPHRGVYQSLQFSGFMVIISQTLTRYDFALVDVTGTWGFTAVPEDVERACVTTVSSWLTRTAPGAQTPYGAPMGVGQGVTSYVGNWHIPWVAKCILGQYKRGSARWSF